MPLYLEGEFDGIAGIFRGKRDRYPQVPPYNPPEAYPEYRLGGEPDPSNFVYDAVRRLFVILGYHREAHGSSSWNPLSWLVTPGDVVYIKPNMIAQKHHSRSDWDYVITHGSVIRAVVDYVFLALEGRGRIIIGDAPQTDSDFGEIVRLMGLDALRKLYAERANFPIDVVDMRREHTPMADGILVDRIPMPGDPEGAVCVNLGGNSMFSELDGRGRRYYGAYYDVAETNAHHTGGRHEYEVSVSPLRADVFINLPKLKTHKKCGLTVNLKSLVGINANKNLLPHYAIGTPADGGDQFSDNRALGRLENKIVLAAKRRMSSRNSVVTQLARRLKRSAYALFGSTEDVIRSGNWYGNDTVWRMCLDLNRILLYADRDGVMHQPPARKRYLSIVDGVIGMEGAGPVAGQAKHSGVLIGGSDPVVVDATCAVLMGFSPLRVPLIARAFHAHPFPLTKVALDSVKVASNNDAWSKPLVDFGIGDTLSFKPHFGWMGHVELTPDWYEQRDAHVPPSN